jgi:transcriptional regulator with XRE-family HTH domain
VGKSSKSMKPRKTPSEVLRDAITTRGLTAYALSRQTGVSIDSIQRFMNGTQSIRSDAFDTLCGALGLDLWDPAAAEPEQRGLLDRILRAVRPTAGTRQQLDELAAELNRDRARLQAIRERLDAIEEQKQTGSFYDEIVEDAKLRSSGAAGSDHKAPVTGRRGSRRKQA